MRKICLSLFLILLLIPLSASAASKKKSTPLSKPPDKQLSVGGFAVSPPKVENVQIAPGQTITGTVRIFTRASGDHYKIDIGDATQAPDGHYIFTPASGNPLQISSWLKVQPNEFDGGVGSTESINWTLQVPKEAEPGDHVGYFEIHQYPKGDIHDQTKILGSVVVLFEATVQGDLKFNPSIKSVDIPRLSNGSEDVPVGVIVANNGNVRLDLNNARARVEIVSGGKVLQAWRIDGIIFPGLERKYSFVWKDAPHWGAFKARVTIDFKDKQKGKTSSEASFYVFPYREALAGLAALLGLVIIILALRRRGYEYEEDEPEDEDVLE